MSSFNFNPNAPMGPPPPGQTTNFNQPVDQQHYDQFLITLAVVASLSTLSVLLRLWTRMVIVRRPGWDDAFAFIAFGFNTGHTYCAAMELHFGAAYYDWNISEGNYQTYDDPGSNYYHAVAGVLFSMVYCFTKLSILAFYLRVLTAADRKLRIAIYILMFISTATMFGFLIAELTRCTPTEKQFYYEIPGKCGSFEEIVQIFQAQTVISAVTDMFILIPPMPIIWNLSASYCRKIAILLIFGMGFAVTAIAIVRCVLMFPKSEDDDEIIGQFPGTYWTFVEVNLALLVINLPALSQLFVRTASLLRCTPRDAEAHPSPDASSDGRFDPGHAPAKQRSPISIFVSAFYSGIGLSRHSRGDSYVKKHSQSSYSGSVAAGGSRLDKEDGHFGSASTES